MAAPNDRDPRYDRVLLLFLLGLFLLISPLMNWWAADDSPWYAPYLLWLGLIGLAAAVAARRDRHDL